MTTPKIIPTRNLGLIETQSEAPADSFTHANPLEAGTGIEIANSSAITAWAGWFDESANPETGVFPSDFRVWNEGLGVLRQRLEDLVPSLEEHNATLTLRPALGLVLSDPHSIASLLKELASDRVKILVDPVAMLTPEMASFAGDHLPRFFHKLGEIKACTGVVLAGAAPVEAERHTHRRLDPAQDFDRILIQCWRDSVFVDRGVYLMSKACRAHIA